MTKRLARHRFRSGATAALGVLVLAASVLPASAETPGGRLLAVRFWSLGDVTRVAIETDHEIRYRTDRVPNPDRIFFDLRGITPKARRRGIEAIPVGDKLLKQIRIAETQPGVTRVVLDLEDGVEYSASQLAVPDRLIIELRAAKKAAVPPVRSVTGNHPIPPDTPESEPAAEAKPGPRSETRKPGAETEPVSGEPTVTEVSTVRPPAAEPRNTAATKKDASPAKTETERDDEAKAGPSDRPSSVPDESAAVRVAATRPAAAGPGTGSGPRSKARTRREASAAKPETPAATTPDPPARAAEDPGAASVAQQDSRGNRSLIRALGLKIGRVVLDPGHGGHDTGTIGPGGLAEKDVVLDVARRLGALITERLGSEVVYTRSTDVFVPLETRTQFANEKKADLFLSIHANSSRLKNVSGPETFYLNLTASSEDLEVAATENATSQRSIYELQELVQKIARKEKVQESREFAASVQTAMYGGLRGKQLIKNRGVKKAPFIVLIGAQMPSVLAEIAFLSNPREEKQLRRPDYRQRIAESLFKGLAQYANTLSHFEVARSRGM